MEKIPTKMLRKLIFSFHPKKQHKYPFLGRLKWQQQKNRSSVVATILRVILKKIVLGLDGKNSTKDAQEVEFQFSPPKTAKIPPFRPLRIAITKKPLVR
jgi:hypothetical protein